MVLSRSVQHRAASSCPSRGVLPEICQKTTVSGWLRTRSAWLVPSRCEAANSCAVVLSTRSAAFSLEHLVTPVELSWGDRCRDLEGERQSGVERLDDSGSHLRGGVSVAGADAAATLELGLDVAHLDPIGWSATSGPDPTAARYAKTLTELTEALVLWRRVEQASPAGPGRSRNALACSCACGWRIRVARSVLELAPILCAGCAQPFAPEDDEPG